MSWLSEFLHSPIDYIQEEPLKALSLIGAPLAAIAAPFAFPAIGGALGLGAGAAAGAGAGIGAGLGAAGGAAEGAGILGGLGGLFGGAEAAAGGGGADILSSLGIEGISPDALSSFASAGEGGGVPFSEANFDWVSRMYPSEFGSSFGTSPVDAVSGTNGIDLSAVNLGDLAGGGGGGLVTDAGGTAAGETAAPGFLDKLWSGATNSVTKNPLGVALAGGALGYNMLQGNKTSPEMDAMSRNAGALNAQGQELMKYLQSGTLPPGLQQGVNNATAAMKARIVANHARNGNPTDPNRNSALAQELNQVDLNAMALIAQQGQQLLTTGMNATNMSSQLYGMLEQLNRQQSQQTGQAIANFASALSGPSITIRR